MTRDRDGLHTYCDHCVRGASRLTRFDAELLCPACATAARVAEREQRYHTDSARAIERGERRPR